MKNILISCVLLIGLLPLSVTALTIDTNPWDGGDTIGWLGSGQSFTVDNTENIFDDITFYFNQDSWGRTFDFYLTDAANFGNTLYTTSFTAAASSLININQSLIGGSTVYALIDFRGFNGVTTNIKNQSYYTGGNSFFGPVNNVTAFTTLDHRFIANFSGESIAVPAPIPATLTLVGLGLAALGFSRRKRAYSLNHPTEG